MSPSDEPDAPRGGESAGAQAGKPGSDRTGEPDSAHAGEPEVGARHGLQELIAERRAKAQRLHQASAEGDFPYSYPGVESIEQVRAGYEHLAVGEETEDMHRVAGRLAGKRGQGRAAFLDLVDRGGKIQLHARLDVLGKEVFERLRSLDLGDLIGVDGAVLRSRHGELTLRVERFAVLAKALRPPPDKHHGLTDIETRHRQRELDLISSEDIRQRFRDRARIVAAIRAYLDGEGFLEVETPVLQPIYGGALARPFMTHHNALDRTLYLRIATELYLKRCIVGGLERVYELGKDFRNEGISTRHNPEFTMVEWYEAYADYNDAAARLEALVRAAAQAMGRLGVTNDPAFPATPEDAKPAATAEDAMPAATPEDAKPGDAAAPARPRAGGEDKRIDFSAPWRRVSFVEAIREVTGIDVMAHSDAAALAAAIAAAGLPAPAPAATWPQLADELLSSYVEPTLREPTFVFDYPTALSPFAREHRSRPGLAERWEAFVGGMEIANAFSELTDPDVQRERFESQRRLATQGDEETQPHDEIFLQALEHGMPPTGGVGVGIDRLVMALTGQTSIREVVLFPATR
jgi:lysyl-tRNA synthetase class 2